MTARYLLLAAAAVVATAAAPAPQAKNPVATVVETSMGSHIIGNPEAKHTLTEYMSYTCSHCAEFERQGAETIKLAYVGLGKYRFEIRHYLFNTPDLAIATATHCLPNEKFFLAHSAILKRQNEWAPKVFGATSAQQARWRTGTTKQQLSAAASDIGLYEMMENYGLSRVELNKCFGNPEVYQPIVDQASYAAKAGINSTPTFLIDGQRLPGNTWPYVRKILDRVLALKS